MSGQAPGGLSQTDFKTVALESGQWLWGMVQGAFNQKATLSQIVVDAVIGMIPLVGDVTAVRDITAVTTRMVDEEEARNNVWEWVLLVVLVLALIPVLGGVLKGVGRLIIKAAGESGHIANAAAKTSHMVEAAKEVITFLNRLGHGHAEKWLLKLKFAEYQAQVLQHFKSLMDTMAGAFTAIENKLGRVLSGALRQRVAGLKNGVLKLKTKGEEMIPQAIKELDAKLLEIQTFIRSGGETTSRATTHTAAAGDKAAIHMTDEARLFEEFGAKVSPKGGLMQNVASAAPGAEDFSHIYKHKAGYPDLVTRPNKDGQFTLIEAYAGKIVNRELKEGEEIYRVFGPPGTTHGVPVGSAYAGGAFWGVGKPPVNADTWRRTAAVRDEWNRDGFMVVGTVPKNANVKSCVGLISEQVGEKIQGQYLQGGAMQAFIDWGKTPRVDAVTKKTLQQTGEEVIATGKAAKYTDPVTGMVFDVKPTGWADANGIHGYVSGGTPGSVSVAPLASTEVASKTQTAPPSRGTARTDTTQAARGAARTQTSNN
jgi:hypothetical protein